jgi:uncharacterized protein
VNLSGSYRFEAPVGVVWQLLTDPDVLASTLPGCDKFEPLGDDRYRAQLTMSVAAISGSYAVTVAMQDKVAPRSYRLLIDGSGKPGFVKGDATVVLLDHGEETVVNVDGTGTVGGLVARVGQRLLGTVSKTMMDRFFAALAARARASR